MATHENISFSLDKKKVVLVKPSKPTPSEVLSFSTIDNDPNVELICQTIYAYQENNVIVSSMNGDTTDRVNRNQIIFSNQKDPAAIIEEALTKVLVYYYPLAGKLKRQSHDGKLQINCNADGVPFLVATADCQLSSLRYLDGIDVETAKKFVFNYPSDDSNIGYHPLVLQVTKFSCGGFTIGMGLSHAMCDGFGAAQFFRALAELASGKSEPTVKPVWERERLAAKPTEGPFQFPLDLASIATSPYVPSADMAHECFNVNSDSITRLKMSLMKEADHHDQNLDHQTIKESFTTLEVVGAYVWRSRLRALNLNPDGKTIFSVVVGLRRIFNPPLPDGYYGNAFVSANVVLTVKDLNESPLSKTVQLIKESKKLSSTNEYVKKALSDLERMRELNVKIGGGTGSMMMLTDWRQLGVIEEVDFGWKGSVNIIPVPWNMFGYIDLCMFLPPCKLDPSMKGGVRVLVCLPRAAMAKFKEEMDALKVGQAGAAGA
ncbi:spermidine coumaroyl-CoA acyltransferase [Carica papaya]|uniref:spermidine coumaroyl-CoA acyltransferase n=1 Tax=Carica papaya TaxID=3649 RepID=UPI000B8CD047|nr:spermidine coumaroyl-CoA acyltransferase [Carica papaya]